MNAPESNSEYECGCTSVRAATLGSGAPSLGTNMAWALGGNVLFAACQWGMLIALARLGSSAAVGQFALGLAIATPVITLANLQLRSVQATDAENRYSFGEYFGLRRKTTLLALVAILAIALVSRWRLATSLVVLSVGLAKAVESWSDIHYGLFQNRELMGIIARSIALRGTLGLGAMAAVLFITRSAIYAVVALVLTWGLVLIFYDIRRGGDLLSSSARSHSALAQKAAAPRTGWFLLSVDSREFHLARIAFPLGFVTALVSLQLNVPRYFVQWRGGEATLGIFSAIAYLGTLLTVFIDAMGLAATPRLAKYFSVGDFHKFRSLLARLTAFGGLAGAAAVAIAALGGGLILRLAYGSAYARYRDLFVWLMLAAGIGCVGTLLCCALTAGGRFRPQVPMYGVVVAAAIAGCAFLTPRYGVEGAAVAMSLAATLHVLLSALVVWRMLSESQSAAVVMDMTCPADCSAFGRSPMRSQIL